MAHAAYWHWASNQPECPTQINCASRDLPQPQIMILYVYLRRRSHPLCNIWVANILEAPQSLHFLPNIHLAAQVFTPR